jgi:hypothetical protein
MMACFRPEFRKRATGATTTLPRILFLKMYFIYSTAIKCVLGGGEVDFMPIKQKMRFVLKLKNMEDTLNE